MIRKDSLEELVESDGCETMIPGMYKSIDEEGAPHRGAKFKTSLQLFFNIQDWSLYACG